MGTHPTPTDAARTGADNRPVRVLFVHRNFPAHFGHIARHLSRELGRECMFLTEHVDVDAEGEGSAAISVVRYTPQGGATKRSHYFSRTFENAIAHAAGVHEACEEVSATFTPDLIVGHSGFGSTLLLPEVFPEAPIVNLFEYFYRPHESDLDFRPDFPPLPEDVLRSRARNAMIMLDLEQCAAGYAPTEFQRSLFPTAYSDKIEAIHDGIDTSFWRRRDDTAAVRERLGLDASDRVVTFCARGLEAMRGFDIFMRAARHVYDADPCARFVVVGSDDVAYGGDLRFTGGRSFREHVLDAEDYDLSRFRFLGRVPRDALAEIFSVSDVHVYLTVPFVLSWSMLDAMSCGCAVVGSDTAPVSEVITSAENGVLCDFFDAEGFAAAVLALLEDERLRSELGGRARETVTERYDVGVTLPRMLELYEQAAAG